MNDERRTRLWLRKQKIKHYTESNRWVRNEWGTKDKSCPSFCVAFVLLFAVVTILSVVLCSVLYSVCRSHNLVLRSSFITHPSITFCVVFYLLFVVVTILSFVPHSLLTQQKIKHYTESNRWVSNEWGTKDNIETTANRRKNATENEGQDCDYDKQKIKH
jgi:uncharacterized membrane protein